MFIYLCYYLLSMLFMNININFNYMLTGDDRVNQNPQLTLLQTMLVREHNRIAIILGHINPHWFDETIYQETRRIMIAQHQFITYYEWLPIIIGTE